MIFITGLHGVGKTYLAKFLEKEGFIFIDCGPVLREKWQQTFSNVSFLDFIAIGEQKTGMRFTDDLIVAIIADRINVVMKANCKPRILVVGNRSPQGIQYIRSKIKCLNSISSYVVYINANKQVLFERYKKREDKSISWEKFLEILEKDKKMGVERIKEITDFVIENNGSIQEFEAKINDLFFRKISYEKL